MSCGKKEAIKNLSYATRNKPSKISRWCTGRIVIDADLTLTSRWGGKSRPLTLPPPPSSTWQQRGLSNPQTPEMAWVPEFLLSHHATLPAGWEEYELIDALTGQPNGAVRYRNHISGDEGLHHPFRNEVASLFQAVDELSAKVLAARLRDMDDDLRREKGYDNNDIDAIDVKRKGAKLRWVSTVSKTQASAHVVGALKSANSDGLARRKSLDDFY
ncbi:hypothetical protein T492DRAFT_844805 [Pavlovales sp. CCMP2436]|nr:hypothetical protein T492DRAFT_844805 [Pavlovales sp. CCMP2436]